MSLLLCCLLTFFLIGCSSTPNHKFDALHTIEGYKNVILMIGDGMGDNHLKVAEAYNEKPLFITHNAAISGWMKTSSSSSNITDSAAAATAMSTGFKVNNGNIANKNGLNLTTMGQFAKAYGKGAGLIATEVLTGATPASFSAHNKSRQNQDQIAFEQIRGEVDLFIGAGREYYDGLTDEMDSHNLSYYTNFDLLEEDIDAAIAGNSLPFTRFLASYEHISFAESSPTSPTLKDASLTALRYLENRYDEQGFFLMIEGSHIDKRAHNKDLMGMINQLNGFDEAVAGVVDWAVQNENTFVLVTADHETGGLEYHGETKSELNDGMFSTGGHTAQNVPFFIYNSRNLDFIDKDEIIDNTDVAKLYRAMIRQIAN
ncbi:MAG: alkaline phosphatase [Bacilli bacterium]|jgi:alkaline phosphatase